MMDERSLEFREWLKSDFRNCLTYVWSKLGLPTPTELQYDFANELQNGGPREIFQAFRGFGKSFILSAFTVWLWLHDHNRRILVCSGGKDRAAKFTTAVLGMLRAFPAFQYLFPNASQRGSALKFDVRPAGIDQNPSLLCVGLEGQLVGARADVIIADDIETSKNSQTQPGRDIISARSKEFSHIVKPIHEGGKVVVLGTPQHEASIYVTMVDERGYRCTIWPARLPTPEQVEQYHGRVAPTLQARLDAGVRPGTPTDPVRFPEEELCVKEGEVGISTFMMQFMLSTALSDMDRYPLRLADLIVMPLDTTRAPATVVHTNDEAFAATHLPCVGFPGDRLYKPYSVTGGFIDYDFGVLVVDPSGRGKDETAYAVLKVAAARIHLLEVGGVAGGYSDQTMTKLVDVAKYHKVNVILVESNFGDGMFLTLLTPFVTADKNFRCGIEEIRHTTQKEARIIASLEPVMNQHRLVVAEDVVRMDYHKTPRQEYQLFHQLTRITKERGCLGHDDRADTVAAGVVKCQAFLSTSSAKAGDKAREAWLKKEMERRNTWLREPIVKDRHGRNNKDKNLFCR